MKKQKFKAIKKKILIPDNCYFHDLGESDDFYKTFFRFLNKNFDKSERPYLDPLSYSNIRSPGCCASFNIGDDKYALISYMPKSWYSYPDISNRALLNFIAPLQSNPKLVKCFYWMARGHEEGHALIQLGLEKEIKNILGDIDYSDNEAVCDLLGLYAADIKKLGHLMPQEKREYMERAVRWQEYRKEAEETHKQASEKKGSITAVMSVEHIVERLKESERK
jgi:hypothetical protein